MGTVQFALPSWFDIVRDVWRQKFSVLSKTTNNISVVSSHFNFYLRISALMLPTVQLKAMNHTPFLQHCRHRPKTVSYGSCRGPCKHASETLICPWFHFTDDFFNSTSNTLEKTFCCYPNSNEVVAMEFYIAPVFSLHMLNFVANF